MYLVLSFFFLLLHLFHAFLCSETQLIGKSTVACALSHMLYQRGNLSYILDGDNVRHGLNRDLSFKAEDRAENIRRVGKSCINCLHFFCKELLAILSCASATVGMSTHLIIVD